MIYLHKSFKMRKINSARPFGAEQHIEKIKKGVIMPIEKNKLAAVMELLCRADADNASGNTEKIN